LAGGVKFSSGSSDFFSQFSLCLAYQDVSLLAGFSEGGVAMLQTNAPVSLALPVDFLPRRLQSRFVLAGLSFCRGGLFTSPRQCAAAHFFAPLHNRRQWAKEDSVEYDKQEKQQENRWNGLKEQLPELVERVTHLKC
jgi:hypothetical protein